MDIDNDKPVVYQPTDQEIVKQDEKNEECEDENKAVKERISIDKGIQMTRDLITGLEQRNFITEQEIVCLFDTDKINWGQSQVPKASYTTTVV